MPRWSAGRRAPSDLGARRLARCLFACPAGHAPVRRSAPAPSGATPPRARGNEKEAPPGALYGRKNRPTGRRSVGYLIVIPDGSQRDPIRDPGTPVSTAVTL